MKDITQEERKIYALYDNNTIRVYQAYNAEIAEEALKLGTFNENDLDQTFLSMDDVQMWMG